MIDHDKTIGVLLNLLEELGIVDDTFVMYSTDNGPHCNSWPDAGTTPFRSEKNTNWEGAYRVPCLVRWPGHIKPGSVSNDIVAHLDWLPTLAAMAGAPNIKEELKAGTTIDGKPYKVYIDGICQLDHITGKGPSKREGFLYWTDDGELSGVRVDNWKFVFMEQRMQGTCMIWAEPLTTLRLPKIFNLRTDPYEFADITSNSYWDWMFDHVYLLVPAQAIVGQVLSTFAEFPPRQKAASFNLSGVLEKMHQGATGGA
jgi:arylsulfatase